MYFGDLKKESLYHFLAVIIALSNRYRNLTVDKTKETQQELLRIVFYK